MATTTDMIMDTDVLNDKGPYWSAMTSNTGSSTRPNYNDITQPGTSPTAGIDYIDVSEGGVMAVRNDLWAGPTKGIRPVRHLTFNGDTIVNTPVFPNRIQGKVGASGARGRTQVRVASALSEASQIPDQQSVMGAFLNPALASLLKKRSAS